MASFIKANNTFAITLLKMLCQEEGKDVLFSPPSISFTLAMVLLGAKNDTAAQIEQVITIANYRGEDLNLCFQSLLTQMNEPDPSYLLETTNRLFGENVLNFLPSFKESCEKFYNSVLEHVCFSEEAETMRKHINAWVEDNTEGKILEAVPMDSVNPLNLLIFVNAIKFKLTWKTDPEPMKRTPRSHKQEYRFSQIISKEKLFLGFYIEELNATVYISSYDQTELIIIFVFPRDDGKKMEKELTYETFIAWTKPDVRALKKILGKQFLPKIKIEKSYDMFNILCSLGMCDAFHKDKADFSGLSELKAFYLLSVFHSSSLEFNEEGIQASAATVALEIPGNAQGKRRCKTASLYFFFIWSQKIKSILFCGRISSS
ncbi:serpin B6-like [Dromiciops gliroides]|uniref:serpin B6-like n=1 Tax=Dromiciops gliroides TaxID=33562 RepID=UPI001CC7245F|nr:serpin B6-like [Dromiciops gliroides]